MTTRLEQSARFHQVGKALLFDKTANSQDHRNFWLCYHCRRSKARQIQPVIDGMNRRAVRAKLSQILPIGIGAGHDKGRRRQLCVQQPVGVEFGQVDVFGMGGKAKGNSSQVTDQHGDGRRAVAKVTVQMVNRTGGQHLIGNRPGL